MDKIIDRMYGKKIQWKNEDGKTIIGKVCSQIGFSNDLGVNVDKKYRHLVEHSYTRVKENDWKYVDKTENVDILIKRLERLMR
jgi:hypothetical protein